jgi:sucrose-6-phosphate hydrolase SacC (GH32 family)
VFYTAHPNRIGADYVRTSKDLKTWSEEKKVAFGGAAGTHASSAECPFVYFHKASGYYYLFRTQHYGQNAQTSVYRSKDPMNFGIEDDRFLVGTLPVAAPEIVEYEGQLYIAALLPSLKGIQIAKLKFAPK